MSVQSKIWAHFDRLSETAARNARQDAPWETDAPRGALDLKRDGAQHRRYHALFEDLQN